MNKLKFDQVLHSEVTEEELRDFQEQWQIPVLKTCNKDGRKLADGSLDGRAGLMVCIVRETGH